MLYFFYGTDTETVRAALNSAVEAHAKDADVIRITDAHTLADLDMALMGGGMFGGRRVVVLDGVLANEEMRVVVMSALARLRSSSDTICLHEYVPDAATKKQVEKYAEQTQKFELAKGKVADTIFNVVRPLQDGKKKDLWVAYQREILAGKAPEAIHGMFFYAAKDLLLKRPQDARARRMVAELAELPHESRRSGYELEYALERFVLSVA